MTTDQPGTARQRIHAVVMDAAHAGFSYGYLDGRQGPVDAEGATNRIIAIVRDALLSEEVARAGDRSSRSRVSHGNQRPWWGDGTQAALNAAFGEEPE